MRHGHVGGAGGFPVANEIVGAEECEPMGGGHVEGQHRSVAQRSNVGVYCGDVHDVHCEGERPGPGARKGFGVVAGGGRQTVSSALAALTRWKNYLTRED